MFEATGKVTLEELYEEALWDMKQKDRETIVKLKNTLTPEEKILYFSKDSFFPMRVPYDHPMNDYSTVEQIFLMSMGLTFWIMLFILMAGVR